LFKPSKGGSGLPHFFCENCGAEVPRNAKNCPKCGRHFASVRCPACDFIGEEALFRGGCPVCGYSSGASALAGADAPEGTGDFADFPESRKPSGSLPPWVYILTAAVFTATLAAVFFTIFK